MSHASPKDLDGHRFKPVVEADRQESKPPGRNGTPFFFIKAMPSGGGGGPG